MQTQTPNTPTLHRVNTLLLALTLFGLSAPAISAPDTNFRQSKSISYQANKSMTKIVRDKKLKQTAINKKLAFVEQGFRSETGKIVSAKLTLSARPVGDITVDDAWTELIEDYNDNGYYHRFSVGVDADTIFSVSYIYVKLYLSYEGGPWNHYATSDDYHIYGDESDELIIETELDEGYKPGYYDIKVEVYNADDGDWLVSYGPNQDGSLRDLPLEDSYYDDDEGNESFSNIETHINVVGHGAVNWLLAFLLILFIPALRWFTIQQKSQQTLKIKQHHKK